MKLLLENWRKYLNEEIDFTMSLHDFDQTSKGWRSISNEHPEQQAAAMLRYIEENPDTGGKDPVLLWHLGQAYAMANNTEQALRWMKEANKYEKIPYNKIYQQFTMYFLSEDMENFNNLYSQHKEQIEADTKDTNIQFVKCMKRCGEANNFNYKDAYTSECKC